MAAVLQPGSQVDIHWRARLEAHLGKFTIEPVRSRSAAALSDRLALAGLNAVTTLLSRLMPEREAMPELYQRSEQLLDLLGQGNVWLKHKKDEKNTLYRSVGAIFNSRFRTRKTTKH